MPPTRARKGTIRSGGIGTAIILLVVVFAAFHFRYRRLPKELSSGKCYDGALWLSGIAILLAGIYSAAKLF